MGRCSGSCIFCKQKMQFLAAHSCCITHIQPSSMHLSVHPSTPIQLSQIVCIIIQIYLRSFQFSYERCNFVYQCQRVSLLVCSAAANSRRSSLSLSCLVVLQTRLFFFSKSFLSNSSMLLFVWQCGDKFTRCSCERGDLHLLRVLSSICLPYF